MAASKEQQLAERLAALTVDPLVDETADSMAVKMAV